MFEGKILSAATILKSKVTFEHLSH